MDEAGKVEVAVDPRGLLRALSLGAIALIAIGGAVAFLRSKGLTVLGLLARFDPDQETAVLTWYSAMLIAGLAGLLLWKAAIARRAGDVRHRWWTALALLMLALSLDEVATFHEWGGRIVDRFDEERASYLSFGWVVIGGLVASLTVGVFARFVFSLDQTLRRPLVFAAGLYLAGALALEMVGASISESAGKDSASYTATMLSEESLELAGTLLAVRTLLHELVTRRGILILTIRGDRGSASAD